MALPTGTGVSAEDIDVIAERIHSALAKARRIRWALAARHGPATAVEA